MKTENSLDYNWQDDYSQTPYICKDLEKILKNTINLDAQTHLDVGCGNGAITKNISKFFKKSTGIDLSLEGINQANKNKDVNIDFLHLSLNSLIEKKILYDFVTTIEVIEHQYDPQLFLSQLSQVTKENGRQAGLEQRLPRTSKEVKNPHRALRNGLFIFLVKPILQS